MDTKRSLILGGSIIIAALIVTLVPRVGVPVAPSQKDSAAVAAPSQEVGRYQMVRVTDRRCYLLDTKTGKLWESRVPFENQPDFWSVWSETTAPWAKQGK